VRTYSSKGIVIRRINTGEADKIVTILTKNLGKISLIAKGVRKLKSRKSSSLEIFTYLKFQAARGKNIDILTETESQNSFPNLRHHLILVGAAYHYCELVDKLLPDGLIASQVSELLLSSMENLASSSGKLATLPQQIRLFEIKLLTILGFGLPESLTQQALVNHIETIIEKPLKSRLFLLRLYNSR